MVMMRVATASLLMNVTAIDDNGDADTNAACVAVGIDNGATDGVDAQNELR